MDIRNYFSRNSADAGRENGLANLRKGPQTPENKTKTKTPKSESPANKNVDRKRKSDRNIISDDSDPEDPIPSKLSKKIGKPLPNQQNTTRNRKSAAKIQSESDDERKSPKKFTNIRKSPRKKSQKKIDVGTHAEISGYSSSDNDKKRKNKPKSSERNEKPAKEPSEKMKKRTKKLDSDVDGDEDFESPSVKKMKLIKPNKISTNFVEKNKRKESPPKKIVPKLNPISVSDFFGGAKVKNKTQEKVVEIELHSDDDFNETLKNAEKDLLTPASSVVSTRSSVIIHEKTPSKIQNASNNSKKSPRKTPTPTKKMTKTVENELEFDSNSNRLINTPASDRTTTEKTPKKDENRKNLRSKKSPVFDRPAPRSAPTDDDCLSWVEKHRPKSTKQIIGQQGDRSCMNKLLAWLKNWKSWHITKTKEKKKGFGPNDDGSVFKAALLSGSPGIGKTTTAQLCCKELGLNFVEMNASDARNKKTLEKDVAESLACHSMDEYAKDSADERKEGLRHVLIMDEVDGMSGNEDRAGMAELIALIKSTRVPIICICNDRQAQKIRSLSNYCYDLRFHKPQVTQIRGPLMSIAFKEGLKINGPSMDEIIEGANHDIRQILNHLNLLAAGDKQISTDDAHNAAKNARKDTSTNIFETVRVLFSENEETKSMTLMDKTELFFTDYSLVPLFVHENYLNAEQKDKKNMYEKLELISKAAESIAVGDIIDKQIRTGGNWTLLNDQAMFSAVIPAEHVRGYLKGMIQFPQWFGKNSKQGRLQRLLQQLQIHTSLKLSSNFTSLNLDYVPALRSGLTVPLTKGDATSVLRKLESYDLIKEDMDNILELSQFPNAPDPLAAVSAKVKAALTRAYNKEHSKLPYATADQTAGKRSKSAKNGAAAAEFEMDEEGNLKEKRLGADEDEASGDELDDQEPIVSNKIKTSPVNKKGRNTVAPTRGRGRGKK